MTRITPHSCRMNGDVKGRGDTTLKEYSYIFMRVAK
jgi:hypothetical protein